MTEPLAFHLLPERITESVCRRLRFGFDNDAHRLGKLKLPLKELADAANHALKQFRKAPQAMKAVLGQASLSEKLGETEVKQLISKFIVSFKTVSV